MRVNEWPLADSSKNFDLSFMPSIEDFPPEVWLDIFEYLNLSDLFVFNKVYGKALSWLIAQAGRKLVKKFLITAKFRLDSSVVCPESQPLTEVPTPPLVPMPLECLLQFRDCFFRTLKQTNNSDSNDSMTFHFPSCTPRCKGHCFDHLHPCAYGTEPAAVLSLLCEFGSKETLADGSSEILCLTYGTEGHGIPLGKSEDKVNSNGETIRTISDRMPLCHFQLQLRASTDPFTYGLHLRSGIPISDTEGSVELPQEWIDCLDDSIQVLIQYRQNKTCTHPCSRCPNLSLQCSYYLLDFFEVNWTLRNGSKLGLPRETVVIEGMR